MKRHLALAWLLLGLALMLIPFTVFLNTSASNSGSRAEAPVLARLGDRATVHAEGRTTPRINLADGREVLTAYAGDREAQRLLQQNLVQPLAMASSDLDEDGVPDLVSGYAAPNGGMLTLHLGNVDAIYPKSPEAQQRKARAEFIDQPFLSPARAFETPRPDDFIGCGDFDADGHWDVVTAARQDNALYLLPGDGHGNFAAARRIELPGRVTALATGEVNRADGLTDVVVGIVAANGPKALVFESPEGALRGKAEEFDLPAEGTAIAIGNLDEEYTMDIVVTAGSELVVIYGRDHKLSLDEQRQGEVPEARISQRSFPFALKGMAIGDFKGDHKTGLSLLTSEGSVHLLTASEAKTKKKKQSAGVESWKDEVLASGVGAQATQMVCARVSGIPSDDLVIVDPASRELHLIAGGKDSSAQASSLQPVSLDVESEPVAVLPMRLKSHALSDLVVLRSGTITPSSVVHIAAAFPVINTNDSGAGSLRQAIINANGNAGLDMITFAIGSGPQTITPLSILPNITDAVVIDGTTQPGFAGAPIIELNGSSAGAGASGLVISAGNSTVRGLVINRFNVNGIEIQIGGNNVIERNYIGINNSGVAPNGDSGVLVDGTSGNTIGGTTSATRNVISGNSFAGVNISGGASNTLVLGNFIGTGPTGFELLGNTIGVVVNNSQNNSIGGNSPGAGNLISANAGSGVVIQASSSNNQVKNNLIGTDVSGSGALGNGGSGVAIASASNNIVGGTSGGDPNTIAFNALNGIAVQSGVGNALLSNSIFGNGTISSLGINIADDVVTANDDCDPDSGPNDLQNYPVLTSATSDGATTTNITGTLNSGGDSTYTIEFFANNTCHPSGFGDGQTFIGSTSATTNASCIAPINVTFPAGVTPGQVITATATNGSNSTSEFSQCVTVAAGPVCTLTCPPNLFASTSPAATLCGTVVTYSPTSDGCGTVTCAPPSGSVFAVGTTTVSCTAIGGPTCSFSVTVVDNTPPTINCPTGVTAPLPAGKLSAAVNYPAPTATDNCTIASVVCVPPSGSTFPAGSTLVTCKAADLANNASNCFFFVTLLDGEVPVIVCPPNVTASLPVGQTSSVVNYPPPTVTDNFPGVTFVCSPRSGSSFPAGSTTVTCTATDAGGNKSSCSFIVGVGGSQAKVNLPGNKTAVEFAAAPTRKPLKPKNNPCAILTLENVGFAPLILTLDSIARTGSSVDSGRIIDPNDTRFFSLSLVNSDQSLTPLDIGAVLTVQPGQVQNLCAKFAALIPALAGKTTGLAASNVLPDTVTSKIVFRQNGGANITVPLLGRVSTALVLVNLSNPRALPEVLFTKSGNDITVSYAVFDSNLDVSRAKYEFLDNGGQVVAGPFEIDLAASISSANLVRGQSFSVEQKFTGASSNPEVTGVRLTVFDGETSAGAPSTSSATSTSAASVQLMNRARRVTLYPPSVEFR